MDNLRVLFITFIVKRPKMDWKYPEFSCLRITKPDKRGEFMMILLEDSLSLMTRPITLKL
jgi:hypothetical protein